MKSRGTSRSGGATMQFLDASLCWYLPNICHTNITVTGIMEFLPNQLKYYHSYPVMPVDWPPLYGKYLSVPKGHYSTGNWPVIYLGYALFCQLASFISRLCNVTIIMTTFTELFQWCNKYTTRPVWIKFLWYIPVKVQAMLWCCVLSWLCD